MLPDLDEELRFLERVVLSAGGQRTYLIGSRTTGEFSAGSSSSDLDVVVVAPSGAAIRRCFEIAHRVRSEAGPRFKMHLGVRCRAPEELEAFARYLAMQGYHTDFAIELLQPSIAPVPFPRPSLDPVDSSEYLCLLGETLWTELRFRSIPKFEYEPYLQAKTCLTYLNCILVGLSRFNPRHADRIRSWNDLFGAHPILDRALACKSGQLDMPSSEVGKVIEDLRSRAFNLLSKIGLRETAFDPAQFWLPAGEGSPEDRRGQQLSICTALCAQLGSPTHLPMAPPIRDAELHHLFFDSESTLVERLNHYRLSRSEESRRDWGSPANWKTIES